MIEKCSYSISDFTLSYSSVNIRLGDYKTSNEGADCTTVEGGRNECTDAAVTIPIETTIPHPNYNAKDRTNDIALIRMIRNAPYTGL